MKNLMKCLIFTAIVVLSFSCKKDQTTPVSGRDKFIGTYAGTRTTLLKADGVNIVYNFEVPITKTIEEGYSDNDIIIGKGTDLEFLGTIDGDKFLIPGQVTPFTIESQGITINVSILGQGAFNTSDELTITYGGYETYDKTEYKWTIVEKLTKD